MVQPIAPREAVTLSRTAFDPDLVAEFTRRGIKEEEARALLANRKPGQDFVAQLEHIEQTIKDLENTPDRVMHPDRFYIRLIERNSPVPYGFETSAKRKAREAHEQMERERRLAKEAEQQLHEDYQDYCDAEINRYIEANQAAFEALKDTKWKEGRERFTFTTESMAKMEARLEIRKQLPLLTFEEFLDRKRQGTDFSLKPVAVPPAAVSPEPVAAAPSSAELGAIANGASVPPEVDEPIRPEASTETTNITPVEASEQRSPREPIQNVETESAMPGPLMIELVTDPQADVPDPSASTGTELV